MRSKMAVGLTQLSVLPFSALFEKRVFTLKLEERKIQIMIISAT